MPPVKTPRKVNYLNNRDILKEIHKSKSTYCSYLEREYAQFDIILPSVDKINQRIVADRDWETYYTEQEYAELNQ